ncbi:hypothetical protein GF322_01175 [Candidatus Dependentiae bacterium]|nr:hypothetical protein [Candidatus Dependentiae bacterium]
MKILIKILMIFILVTGILTLNSDNRILFYLQNPPKASIDQAEKTLLKQKTINKIENLIKKTPGQVSSKLLKNEAKKYFMPKLSGFIALYSGYIDYSNPDGLISFPLRHTKPKLYLIITPRIKLIHAKGNTVSHKELDPTFIKETQIYLFEKKEDENKQLYWSVKKQDLPKNNRINPLSVVLLTKPKNIYIPTGDYLTNKSQHIILPNNIYVVGNIDNTKVALNIIGAKRYFEHIGYKEEKIGDNLIKKIISNM